MFLAAAFAFAAPEADRVFSCDTGTKRVEVTSDGTRFTYRFGRPRKPELTLTGSAAAGNLFHHRHLYARGEDQTLRFVSGAHSYIVYSRWILPSGMDEEGMPTGPGAFGAGVVVLKGGKRVAHLKCRDDEATINAWPYFDALPKDEINQVPEDF